MAPKGTAHRQKRHNRVTIGRRPLPSNRTPLASSDLEGLGQKIKDQFEWPNGPHDFQMRAIEAQLKGIDVLLHAGTGSGKTAVAAGPHVHESSRGKVTLMVSPLMALHDEHVSIDIIPTKAGLTKI